jgi:hypothetical protein
MTLKQAQRKYKELCTKENVTLFSLNGEYEDEDFVMGLRYPDGRQFGLQASEIKTAQELKATIDYYKN